MTSPSSCLRVGTLNVRSLSFKLGSVLALARTHHLHALCLQETCLGQDALPAVSQAVSQAGYTFHVGAQTLNSAGAPYAGVSFLTRWPAQAVTLPAWPDAAGRVAGLRVFRPRARPLLLVGVYLHASDAFAAASLLDMVLPWAASLGEDFCVTGDFNLLKSHWPMSHALAAGQMFDADDVAGDPAQLPGTHRNAEGVLTGRVIDFMLHSASVTVRSRSQHQAVADHDLVHYDLPILGQPARLSWPPRPRISANSPSKDAWSSAWPAFRAQFDTALDSRNVDAAWAAISACLAQVVCDSVPAVAPEQATAPRVNPCQPHRKAPTYQSLLERRLRRLARRAAEFARNGGDQGLFVAISRDVKDLSPTFPELASNAWGCPEAAQLPTSLANQQAERDALARLQHWKATTGEDMHRLCQWVRATVPTEPAHQPACDTWTLHPQHQAEEAAETWRHMWAPTQLPQPVGFQQLRHLVVPTEEYPLPAVTAASLFARFRASIRKATGLDGWGAAAFVSAGLPACEALAQLWALCLQTAELPAAWRRIRVALLPKPEGGLRPISVASAAYRACMTCLLRAGRPWFQSWADPELVGGVPGRSMAQTHDELFTALHDALSSRQALVGAKQDIRKCFDTVQWDLALQAWFWLGAPAPLVSLLRAFYEGQQRWVAVRGHFASSCVAPTRGLLQGCPASVGLLNGLMLLWVRSIRATSPTVSMSVFLDDRALWSTGRGAPDHLCTALQTAAAVDQALALQVHTDKLPGRRIRHHTAVRRYKHNRRYTAC